MAVELGSAVGKITIDSSGVTEGIAAAQRSLNGAESSLQSIGGSATRAGAGLMTLGAPLVAFGVASAKVAGDFESQMNILAVAARGGTTSIDDLRAVALQAGSDVSLVGVSASDVAEAMTNFSKAGLDVNQTLGDMQGYLAGTTEMGGALRAAIDLAAASGLSLDDASTLVVTTMSTFGLTADQAGAAMNNYVQAADASVASVSDLADAMANIGPTAAAFGFSVEDVNTALAILSTRGITGAEAGTALKSMFTNIMRDAPEAKRALAELNVSLYDQAGNMRPMPDIIADLSSAMSGMTDEQRNAYVQTLAGSYGMKAMNTLLAEGKDGWNEMEGAISGAATMQESAAARTQGFNASMEQLKDSVMTFLITVGTPLIRDVLTPLVRILTEVMGRLQKVNPAFLKWAVVVGGVVVALGTFLVMAGQVAGGISAIVGLAGLLGPLFAGLGGAIAAIGAAIAPFLLPILAIAAAVALLYLAWKTNFLGIQEIVAKVGAALAAVFDFIKGIVSKFVSFLKGDISWDQFTTYAENAFRGLKYKLAAIWEDIKGQLATAWEAIKAVFGRALEALGTILLNGIAGFIAPLVGGMDNAKRIVAEAWENIKTFLTGVWEAIKTSAATAWEVLKGIISTAIEAIRTVVAFVMSGLSGDWGTAWEALKAGVVRVWEEIKTGVGSAAEALRTGLGAKLESIRAGAAEKWESIRAGAAEKWEAVWTAISGVVGRIRDFVVATLGELVTAAAGLFGKILAAISGSDAGAGGVGLGGLLNVEQLRLTIAQVLTALQGMQIQIGLIWTAIQLFFTTWRAAETLAFQMWLTNLQLALTMAWMAIQLQITTIWTAIQLFFTTWRATELLAVQTWLLALQLALTTAWLAIQLEIITIWTAIQLFMLAITTQIKTETLDNYKFILGGYRALGQLLIAEVMSTWGIIRDGVIAAVQSMRDGVIAAIQELHDRVMAILNSMKGEAYAAGAALARAFGDGIRSELESALEDARRLAAEIRALLPGSDAETGPLSDLTASGKALPITFGKGIARGASAAVRAAESLANAIYGPVRTPNFDIAQVTDALRTPTKLPDDWSGLVGKYQHKVYQGKVGAKAGGGGGSGSVVGAVSSAQDALIAALDALRVAVETLISTLGGELASAFKRIAGIDAPIGGPVRVPDWGTTPATGELIGLLSGTPTEGLYTAVRNALQGILKPEQSPAQQPITVNVYNPVGQTAEDSIVRQLRTLSYVGVLR